LHRAPRSAPEHPLSLRVPLGSVAKLLASIDDLPDAATGVLRFGAHGVVLVEHNAVCWATAPEMRKRLTDLLRHQVTPPQPRAALESLYAACRANGEPLGERLVASGLVTAEGLRESLEQHNAEALALVASGDEEPGTFTPHKHSRYDARFSFSTTELFTRLSELRYEGEGRSARAALEARLELGTPALVLKREPDVAVPIPIALRGCHRLRLRDTWALARWAQETLDVCGAVDGSTRVVSGALSDERTALAWHEHGLTFVALCDSRPKLARCLSRLHAPPSANEERSPETHDRARAR
jgi:hypothetical protein